MPKPKQNRFAAAVEKGKEPAATEETQASAATVTPITPTAEPSKARKQPSRQNKKHVGGYYDPAVNKEIRSIALEEDTSVEALVAEALNMLFHSRQRPQIASK